MPIFQVHRPLIARPRSTFNSASQTPANSSSLLRQAAFLQIAHYHIQASPSAAVVHGCSRAAHDARAPPALRVLVRPLEGLDRIAALL